MLVDLHEKNNYFISFVYFFYWICQFVLLCFSVHDRTVSYNMYKTLKMPAHWCIYKLMLYILFIKYLFYISEYNAMLIQLLICQIYIKIYIKKYQ